MRLLANPSSLDDGGERAQARLGGQVIARASKLSGAGCQTVNTMSHEMRDRMALIIVALIVAYGTLFSVRRQCRPRD
jgi:hypothetical protein